jgi:Protein of unknown function (DUF2510)
MRPVAKTLMLAGAIVYIVALAALHYWSAGSTYWSEETVGPAVATAIALAVAAFALAAMFTDAIAVTALAVCFSFLLLGDTVYTGEQGYSFYGPGYWLASACSVLMAVVGIFAFSGYVLREPGARRSASDGPAPAGWYEDPSGEAGQRYWTGIAWSEHTR